MHRHTFIKAFAALALALAGTGTSAQAWPAKPIRFVLGAPAGTVPDTAARIVGERLTAMWGQQVVIENKPGAGGTLAMEAVKASPADGYTMMFTHAGAAVVTPQLLKVAKYDPVGEFVTLGVVADSPMVVAVSNNAPYKNLGDIVAAAKAEPGKVTVGSTEQSTLPYLVGHLISQNTGATFLHVPFSNPQQSAQGLSSGDVPVYIDGVATLLPLVKSGRARVVALTTDRALPAFADMPLVKDTVSGLSAVGWFALQAPKGLPADVAARINKDLNQVLTNPQVAAKFAELSLFPNPKSLADSASFVKAEVDKWAAVIKKANLQQQ